MSNPSCVQYLYFVWLMQRDLLLAIDDMPCSMLAMLEVLSLGFVASKGTVSSTAFQSCNLFS